MIDALLDTLMQNLYNYFVTYNDINSNELHIEPNIPDDVTVEDVPVDDEEKD